MGSTPYCPTTSIIKLMGKRAYSPKEIAVKTYNCIEWEDKWKGPFGSPPVNETWFICGQSASGKSSFVMQLVKRLCQFGRALYLSYEEGISQSFQERTMRFKMNEEQGRFRVVTEDTYDELVARLAKPKSAKFVIIDSIQVAGWTYEQAVELTKKFDKKCFIFVSQEEKGQPMGKPAKRLRYIAGMKIWVSGFKAYCQGRFTGDPGSYYTVWEEGVIRTSNNLP